jgi:predicted nucleotidyltransferase
MVSPREGLQGLCSRHRIDLLYVFGSRAGEIAGAVAGNPVASTAPGSDVDIGVLPHAGARMDVREKSSIAIELEELLGVRRVDLVLLPEADPFVAANIIRGELLYFSDRNLADEYELYILRRAGDLAPLERERLSLLERQ